MYFLNQFTEAGRADRLHADLNHLLSEFYSKYASATDAVEWMDKNEYHMATADDSMEEWMRQ